MHLFRGLTHTSSVAMVWGLYTIAGARSRGETPGDESRVVSYLSVRPSLEFVSFGVEVPAFLSSTFWGCHWKKTSVNAFQIWPQHVSEWGICFMHFCLHDSRRQLGTLWRFLSLPHFQINNIYFVKSFIKLILLWQDFAEMSFISPNSFSSFIAHELNSWKEIIHTRFKCSLFYVFLLLIAHREIELSKQILYYLVRL